MRAAEILRKLADIVDNAEGGSDEQGDTTPIHMSPVDAPTPSDSPELDPNPVMVPPLQAKLELLKKSVGVPNFYDEEGDTSELDNIKKNAGINVMAQQEAGEDNDITG